MHRIGIVSVALGLATTIIAFLIMQGFQQNVEQKLNDLSGHLQVSKYALNRSDEETPLEQHRLHGLQRAFPSDIKSIQAFAHKVMLLKAAEDVEGIVCKGLDPVATHHHLSLYLTAGQFIDFKSQGYNQDILLSTQTANRLRVQVGDEVIAYVVQNPPRHRKLRVVGLYSTHIAELDEKLAFCDLRLIQRLNNWPENLAGGYEIFLHDLRKTRSTAEQLLTWLDYDLSVTTTAHKYAAIFDWLLIVRKNALIFTALILLVASSNLASIVLIQMMERTSMIGILKTLGASDGQIQRMMLWNNLYMVGQGVFWGNLMGLGLCALQQYSKLIPLNPTYYYIHYVPIAWNWGVVLGLNLLTLGVVNTVLLVSIAIIVRLRPIRAAQFR
ncbi:MAG: ABC transporter permease [Amoebophilaceae bacterium]|nr:ABC transporter permease [Amoebophilaceae bacterium]